MLLLLLLLLRGVTAKVTDSQASNKSNKSNTVTGGTLCVTNVTTRRYCQIADNQGSNKSNKSNKVTGVLPCVTNVTKLLARIDVTEKRHSEGAERPWESHTETTKEIATSLTALAMTARKNE